MSAADADQQAVVEVAWTDPIHHHAWRRCPDCNASLTFAAGPRGTYARCACGYRKGPVVSAAAPDSPASEETP